MSPDQMLSLTLTAAQLALVSSFIAAPCSREGKLVSRAALCLASAGDRLPLLDPLSDELPFPFPTPPLPGATEQREVLRFTFDRPVYRRLCQAAEEAEERLLGMCVQAGQAPLAATLSLTPRGLATEGAVGVAVRLLDLQTPQPGEQRALLNRDGIEPPTTARVEAAFRFRVDAIVSTFPFASGTVTPFGDAPPADAAEAGRAAALEAEVEEALGELCGDTPEEEVGSLASLLRAHRLRVERGEYPSQAARWEHFSLSLCALLALDHADAVAAVASTAASERLELLLRHLRELQAGAPTPRGSGAAGFPEAVRAVLSGGSFSPIDIPLRGDAAEPPTELPDGARLEYWWNEEWGWCAATVVRRLRVGEGDSAAIVHTLCFDSDGSWEDCALDFSDGGRRWRPLQSPT